jgi:YVTN family beta-propeller protein
MPGQRLARSSLLGTDVFGLPDGSSLTPDAAPGARLLELDPHLSEAPWLRAGGAVATATSPDGATLALVTSGYDRAFDERGDRIEAASGEYVFLYDVRGGAPRETQVVHVPDSFGGLAFAPDASRLYVSGGPDDVVHELVRGAGGAAFVERGPPIDLGHRDARGLGGLGVKVSPFAAGVAANASGTRLVVVEHENDVVTVVDVATRRPVGDVPLGPGGEFPFDVAVIGESRAYVTSQRDRELVEVDLAASRVARRIAVGAHPSRLVANRAGTLLYVADAGADTVSVVDVPAGREVASIPTSGAPAALHGSNPNALVLSPDERTLYVTNGGNSTLAVVALDADGRGGRVTGLVPTGFYPTAVSRSSDGAWLYVGNGRGIVGANPRGPWADPARAAAHPYGATGDNQFTLQLEHGGLLAFPRPGAADLATLTAQSLANARLAPAAPAPRVFEELRRVVKHVIFVVAENRTYDQVLGDLPGADGDPRLVHWGADVAPNQHALAARFVALDRFFATGDVSGDGWQWTMGGLTTDVAQRAIPVFYGSRGEHGYDWEGVNRGINVGLATDDERAAFNPDTPRGLLPGAVDVASPDALLWDAALAAGASVRVYGVFCDYTRYGLGPKDPARIPLLPAPAATGTRVAFPARASLQAIEDPYFRCFDMRFPDAWRVDEWRREFDGYVAHGDLPALEIVRLPHDHFGAFAEAAARVDTPDTQMADHDWAVGRLVESVAHSHYWDDTVVIVVEDDAQNGSDHVDAHRTLALLAGAHVRRGAAVHTPYTTPSVLRTIELLLGLAPMGQHDAAAPPMDDVLDVQPHADGYEAIVPAVLRSTELALPAPKPGEHAALPRRDAAWWSAATAGFDFDDVDAAPAAALARVLWCGTKDGTFPRSGAWSTPGDEAGCASYWQTPATWSH